MGILNPSWKQIEVQVKFWRDAQHTMIGAEVQKGLFSYTEQNGNILVTVSQE